MRSLLNFTFHWHLRGIHQTQQQRRWRWFGCKSQFWTSGKTRFLKECNSSKHSIYLFQLRKQPWVVTNCKTILYPRRKQKNHFFLAQQTHRKMVNVAFYATTSGLSFFSSTLLAPPTPLPWSLQGRNQLLAEATSSALGLFPRLCSWCWTGSFSRIL